MPVAQQKAFTHEPADVANPYRTVDEIGVSRAHKACRRVPHFETLYRSKVIDKTVFVVLEWYAARLELAQSGLYKSCLDLSGGGGTAASHVPVSHAAMDALFDVSWAASCVPPDLLPILDAVVGEGLSFAELGRRFYPSLSVDRAKRKASLVFKLAANYLLIGCGRRVGVLGDGDVLSLPKAA